MQVVLYEYLSLIEKCKQCKFSMHEQTDSRDGLKTIMNKRQKNKSTITLVALQARKLG